MRICRLCGRNETQIMITEHHVVKRDYMIPNSEEILKDLCTECHTDLHRKLDYNIRLMKRDQQPQNTIPVGDTHLSLRAGSQFGQIAQVIDNPTLFYGAELYNKQSRLKEHFECCLSGGNLFWGIGSPTAWNMFVIAEKRIV